MNTADDDQLDLQSELLRAIGAEPVMESLPWDDVARGKRLVRRRRVAAVTVAAVTVPAVALGGWAVSGALDGGGGSGKVTTQLQAADRSNQDSTSSPSAPCAWARAPRGNHHREGLRATVTQLKPGSGWARAAKNSRGRVAACDVPGDGATISSSCPPVSSSSSSSSSSVSSSSSSVSSKGVTSQCDAVPGEPANSPGVDRITAVLQTLDPAARHTGGPMSSGGSVEAGNQASALYAGMDWVDGDLEGAVAISVEDAATAGPATDCQDHAIADGPQVTCVRQTLPDGTTVMVGHGQLDGAERVTVRYDRPDGTAVIVTADEATDQWWVDRSGAAPLTSQPATVDQLIALVRNDRNHL